jgi:tetratricopeptide (TPR) repeat protein
MKKITTYLFSLLLFTAVTTAQNPINDLLKKIANTSEPRTKIDLLEDLNLLWSFYDTTKGAVLMERDAQTMLKLAESANYRRGIGNAYRALGMQQSKKKKYEEALAFYNKAFPFYNIAANKSDVAVNYSKIAKVYHLLSQLDTSLALAKLAADILEKGTSQTDRIYLANSYAIIGECSFEKGLYEKALNAQHKALNIYESIGDKTMIQKGYLYLNMARLHEETNNRTDAYSYTRKALELAEITKIMSIKAVALEYIGDEYRRKRVYDSSLYYYNLVLNMPDVEKHAPIIN